MIKEQIDPVMQGMITSTMVNHVIDYMKFTRPFEEDIFFFDWLDKNYNGTHSGNAAYFQIGYCVPKDSMSVEQAHSNLRNVLNRCGIDPGDSGVFPSVTIMSTSANDKDYHFVSLPYIDEENTIPKEHRKHITDFPGYSAQDCFVRGIEYIKTYIKENTENCAGLMKFPMRDTFDKGWLQCYQGIMVRFSDIVAEAFLGSKDYWQNGVSYTVDTAVNEETKEKVFRIVCYHAGHPDEWVNAPYYLLHAKRLLEIAEALGINTKYQPYTIHTHKQHGDMHFQVISFVNENCTPNNEQE